MGLGATLNFRKFKAEIKSVLGGHSVAMVTYCVKNNHS